MCINNKILAIFLPFLCLSLFETVYASIYPLEPNTDVVGQVQTTTTRYEDSFITLAEKYDVGFIELVQANPTVDPWIPGEGTLVTIPSRHILPPRHERKGIVINIAEMRLYYFPTNGKQVYTYPVGIGRMNWGTPVGKLSILTKKENPTWYVPPSIKEEARLEGLTLPDFVPPGPENPLGQHAMKLSNPSYLIHGTNKPAGIGRRVSHGCIQMYPADVKQLFSVVSVNTPVNIVHEPYKAGWANGYLWFESHQALEEYQRSTEENINKIMHVTQNAVQTHKANVDWELAKTFYTHSLGVPMVIGKTG